MTDPSPKEQVYAEIIHELLVRRNSFQRQKQTLLKATDDIAALDAKLEVIEEELLAYGYKEPPAETAESVLRNR